MMVESTYAGDSPRSRSPMTEPSSPLQDTQILSINHSSIHHHNNHRYLYSYSPDIIQQKLRIIDNNGRDNIDIRERGYFKSKSPLSQPNSTRINNRHTIVNRPNSSGAMSSPASLFTIDSILAPRPVNNTNNNNNNNVSLSTATSTTIDQSNASETVGSPQRTTTIHPLQQQLHHLAFTPADFLGNSFFLLQNKRQINLSSTSQYLVRHLTFKTKICVYFLFSFVV